MSGGASFGVKAIDSSSGLLYSLAKRIEEESRINPSDEKKLPKKHITSKDIGKIIGVSGINSNDLVETLIAKEDIIGRPVLVQFFSPSLLKIIYLHQFGDYLNYVETKEGLKYLYPKFPEGMSNIGVKTYSKNENEKVYNFYYEQLKEAKSKT